MAEEEEEEKRENRLRQWRDHLRRHLYRFAVPSRFKVHATAKARRKEAAGEIEGRVPQKRSRRRQILFSRAISCGDGDGEKGAAIIAAAMTGEGEGGRGKKKGGGGRKEQKRSPPGRLPLSPKQQPGAVQSVAADQGG